MILPQNGQIVEESTDGVNRIGVVEFGGKRRSVYLSLVPGARIGDHVKFQAGFATETFVPPSEPVGQNHRENPDLDFEDLRAYSLLRDLDPQHLRKLLPLAQEQHFATGEILFKAGEQSLFLYLIVSGDVALDAGNSIPPTPVQILTAGEATGWSAVTRQDQTRFQAQAMTPVSTVAFEGTPLRVVCESDPVLGYALMKGLLEIVTQRLDAVRAKLI
jgi:hydrogenase maturation factor